MELVEYVRRKVADRVRLRFIVRDIALDLPRYAGKDSDRQFYEKIQKLARRLQVATPAIGQAPNTFGYIAALLADYGVDLEAPAPFADVHDRHEPVMIKVLEDPDRRLFVVIVTTLTLLSNVVTAAESGTCSFMPPPPRISAKSFLVACRAPARCLRRHDPRHHV
jgi:hypothetical protein